MLFLFVCFNFFDTYSYLSVVRDRGPDADQVVSVSRLHVPHLGINLCLAKIGFHQPQLSD